VLRVFVVAGGGLGEATFGVRFSRPSAGFGVTCGVRCEVGGGGL
jgi:hypothetical protein